MDRVFRPASASALATLVLAGAALYFARPVLAPAAMAILLSIVFAGPSRRLERLGVGRLRLGRPGAAFLLAAAIGVGFAGLGWVVAIEGRELAQHFSEYRRTVHEKVREPLARLQRTARVVREIAEPSAAGGAAKVEVVNGDSEAVAWIGAWAGSAASALATAGIVVVLLLFLLIERDSLRDRVLLLAGRGRLRLTGSALRDASDRVARYVRALTLLNCGHGVVVGGGLALLGLPLAPLFGLVSALLRFVPYAGPWIAACAPLALSIAVSDGWSLTLWIALFLAAVELVSNNIVEPWLFGASVGLSPLAVIAAAILWGWLWGPIGLVLATPLTVSLMVIGRYVPQLEALAIVLGDRPALRPHERVYERMLSRDLESATELIAEETRSAAPAAVWDATLLPVLALLERDRQARQLEPDDEAFARGAFELWTARAEVGPRGTPAVACIPAAPFADEIVCAAIAQRMAEHGVSTRPLARVLTSELVEQVAADGARAVCVSAVAARGAPIRHLVGRLLTRCPDIGVVVGFWGEPASRLPQLRDELPASDRVQVVATLAHAESKLATLAASERPSWRARPFALEAQAP